MFAEDGEIVEEGKDYENGKKNFLNKFGRNERLGERIVNALEAIFEP